MAVVYLYPIVAAIARSFTDFPTGTPTNLWANYTWFFQSPLNVTVLWRTFVVSASVASICLVIGYPFAYVMSRATGGYRMLMVALVLVPFWTSSVVRNYAWLAILGPNGLLDRVADLLHLGPLGLLGTTSAVLIGETHFMLPYMILPIYTSLVRTDRRVLDAAASLGARPMVAFFRAYFPLSLPGVLAGWSLVFALSLGFYVTPAILGSPGNSLFSQLIVTQQRDLLAWGRGGAMAAILLILTVLAFAAAGLATRGLRARIMVAGPND